MTPTTTPSPTPSLVKTSLKGKALGTMLGGRGGGGELVEHPEPKGTLFLLILNMNNLGFKLFIPTLKLRMYNKV